MSELLPMRASFVAGPPSDTIPDADLAIINATAARPFAKEDLAVFACVMATQDLTDYATRLGTSSLLNFAADAKAGTPYLLDHNPDGGIYGYTYDGQYAADKNEARSAVYLPHGRRPGGYGAKTSDQEISDIHSGMRRSISVGFGGPLIEWRCDLCGNDVFSFDCPHLPGMKSDGVLATATVENARLMELSGVFQGACPGAVIGKAEQMYAASRFGAKQFRGWLDTVSAADPTRVYSIPPPPANPQPPTGDRPPAPGKEITPMREKFAAALAALGMTTFAAHVLGAQSDDVEVLAKNLAGQVKTEVDAQIAANPMIQALAAAGLDTPDKLAALKAGADAHAQALAARRETAKASAKIAYQGQAQQDALADIDAMADGPAFDRLSARIEADAEKVAPKNGAQALTARNNVSGVTYADDITAQDADKRRDSLLAATPLGKKALASTK